MSLVNLLRWLEEKEFLAPDVKDRVQVVIRFSSRFGTAFAQFIYGDRQVVARFSVGDSSETIFSVERPSGFQKLDSLDDLLEVLGTDLGIRAVAQVEG